MQQVDIVDMCNKWKQLEISTRWQNMLVHKIESRVDIMISTSMMRILSMTEILDYSSNLYHYAKIRNKNYNNETNVIVG